jgi:RHS repeat-associated protein
LAGGAGADRAALFAVLDRKLEAETFSTSARFDALGQQTEKVEPGGTTVVWRYRRDGLLAELTASRPGASPARYLAATDYNAKSQRQWAVFGDGANGLLRTDYSYDADNFRLTGIATTRLRDGVRLQDLTYWADPEGNVTAVTDPAAPAARVFHGNQEVSPDQDFTYDSLYRLIDNRGRAHIAYSLAMAADGGYQPYFPPSARDAGALERYRMSHDYDGAGNLWRTRYCAASSRWTQTLALAPDSNRGAPTDGPVDAMFDDCGNQLAFRDGPSPKLSWSWANHLAGVVLVARQAGAADAQYYSYNALGVRVRKQTQRLVGGAMAVEETITLGDHTIHRRFRDGVVVEEWRSTRLMDEDRCVAELVDWTVGKPPDGVGAHQDRYQLGNLIDSSMIEVTGDGGIVSYEEFSPFGATVYAAGAGLCEVSLKSYRYAGRDRDKASGLYYYGARYYAPWLCRWLSPDPAGDIDDLNLYAFVGGNPVTSTDVGGLAKKQKRQARPASYANYTTQPRKTTLKHRKDKPKIREIAITLSGLNPGGTATPNLTDLILALPTKKRTRDKQVIDKSLENISKASLAAYKGSKKPLETEVIGESATLLKMIKQPNMHLAYPINPGHGAGLDQVWYKKSGAAKKTAYYIVEAKGPGAALSQNKWSNIGKQMSKKWVESRIKRMINSGDPDISKYGSKLDTTTLPIFGLTVEAKWNDAKGKLEHTQKRKVQF